MYLITFSFWNVVLILIGLALFGFAHRLTWALARYTERFVVFMAQTGLHQLAKTLLAILIGYDEQVYRKSRFMFRNQVTFRFAVLWGVTLFTIAFLFILREALIIQSVSQTAAVLATAVLSLRCILYWTSPRKRSRITTGDSALTSLIQDVNERTGRMNQPGRQIIRRWDYLDELFAEPV